MKTIFDHKQIRLEEKDHHNLIVGKDDISYQDCQGKKFDVAFADVGEIVPLRYCNSNNAYEMLFRDLDGKNMGQLDTDQKACDKGHNILETKSILVAFAANKLTDAFPNNLDTLNVLLSVAFLTRKKVQLSGGVLSNQKKNIAIHDIRRVKCATNGTISDLCIYTKDKGGFFDLPDMKVPVNAITVPLLEAIVTKNTGKGIDFSRGDGFGEKTSEFIIIRYLDSGYFTSGDPAQDADWQKIAAERVAAYGYDLEKFLSPEVNISG